MSFVLHKHKNLTDSWINNRVRGKNCWWWSAEDELRSLAAWGEKLLCRFVVNRENTGARMYSKLSTATPRPISRNMQWICKGHTIQHDHNSSITANFAHVKWDKVVNVDIRERRTRTAYTNICRSEEMISCLFECKAMCALVKVKWMFALVLWKCLCVCTLLFCASFWGSVRPWKSG